jgi:DNA-binding SARP family transcriptional activator
MRFSVLGRLEVISDDGTGLDIAQARQRTLLAVLLLHADQEVSVRRLTGLLCDQDGPTVSPGALRTQVWALRKLLAPARRLHTGQYHGYRLEVGPGELDVAQFRELAGQGRHAVESADLPEAVSCLTRALALWGEPPLADVPATLAMAPLAQRLLDERLAAQQLLNEARLGLGQHADLIPELRGSTATDPGNERFWEQLMLALHGAGRTAEALAVYQQARTSMTAELGVEPGHSLRELHRRILAGDPGPSRPGASPAAGQRPQFTSRADQRVARAMAGSATSGPEGQLPGGDRKHVVPRQLPAPSRPFVGRDAELAELDGLLRRPDAPAAVVISAIGGAAGVGKSALAVHWAHQAADRFPDGQLYLNLRGFDPAGNPTLAAAAIRALLEALGIAADRIPASLDAQAGLYRSLMAGKHMLLVLDNARDAEQVRPLLPGSPGCLVVVTSRSHLAGLAAVEGAHSLRLDLLTDADARALLAARLGQATVDAEPSAAAELVRLCARLPLALVIAAARVAARPRSQLAAFAVELADARSRLDALDTGDAPASVRAVFSWSAGSLSAPAARMFGLLGLHPGPDITVPAAASLAGVPPPQAQAALAELADASLTAEHSAGRFSLHDLLRVYAAEQARAPGSESLNREAVGRILDHYLQTAYAAAGLLNPQREAITLPRPRPAVTAEHVATRQLAQSWFEDEHDVLISAVWMADEAGFDSHAWQLPWAMANFLDWRGYWDEWVATQRTAVAAAARLGDTAARAVTLRLLGQACARLSDHEQARAHLAECTGLYRQLGDADGEARVHQTLSWLCGQLEGGYHTALGHTEQAIALYRASGNQAGLASALNNGGMAYIMLGDSQRGRTNCQQALAIHEELGNLNGQANAWHGLGNAEHRLGNLARAAGCYRHAFRIFRELGKRHSEAGTLADLGDALDAAGDPQGACDVWQQALDILDDLHHSDADQVRAKLRQLRVRKPPSIGAG